MKQCRQYIHQQLNSFYPDYEIESMLRLIVEELMGWSYSEWILNRNSELPTPIATQFEVIVDRLAKHEPLQYILGVADFYDGKYIVDRNVLIPRPETEELVDRIIQQYAGKECRLLDIGTGSGCIAISLAANLKQSTVSGFDISDGALNIAKQNAAKNGVDVHFSKVDILNWKNYEIGEFDVIVSNPPYIRHSEKQQMRDNVLKYEPHLALFVEEDDPLLFYRVIADFALEHLSVGGALFYEINEAFGDETQKMLEQNGYSDVKIINDLQGKARMVVACKA